MGVVVQLSRGGDGFTMGVFAWWCELRWAREMLFVHPWSQINAFLGNGFEDTVQPVRTEVTR